MWATLHGFNKTLEFYAMNNFINIEYLLLYTGKTKMEGAKDNMLQHIHEE